jgi:uncharacterized protein YecT (DUF1311 family)
MRKHLAVFLSMSVFAATAGAAEPLCLHEKNTMDEARCLSGELDKSNKLLADYLDAAKQRVANENNGKPQLDAAQDAWLNYRSLQCGGVYAYWEAGSYRYRADLECEIELTHARTHEIWSAYLRNFGSTPHLRREP